MRPEARVFEAEIRAAKRGRSSRPAKKMDEAAAADRTAAAVGRMLAWRIVADNSVKRAGEPGQ